MQTDNQTDNTETHTLIQLITKPFLIIHAPREVKKKGMQTDKDRQHRDTYTDTANHDTFSFIHLRR